MQIKTEEGRSFVKQWLIQIKNCGNLNQGVLSDHCGSEVSRGVLGYSGVSAGMTREILMGLV